MVRYCAARVYRCLANCNGLVCVASVEASLRNCDARVTMPPGVSLLVVTERQRKPWGPMHIVVTTAPISLWRSGLQRGTAALELSPIHIVLAELHHCRIRRKKVEPDAVNHAFMLRTKLHRHLRYNVASGSYEMNLRRGQVRTSTHPSPRVARNPTSETNHRRSTFLLHRCTTFIKGSKDCCFQCSRSQHLSISFHGRVFVTRNPDSWTQHTGLTSYSRSQNGHQIRTQDDRKSQFCGCCRPAGRYLSGWGYKFSPSANEI